MSGLNNFKADVSSANYVIEKFHENPGKFASLVLQLYWDTQKQRDQYKAERDTLIDDVAILKANNDRLIRRNQKLEEYVRMWEKLTKWKQGKLEERCNNDLLHELSYTMNEIERDMYKERS